MVFLKKLSGAYFKMESIKGPQGTNFSGLQDRLRALVNMRINNGEFTERGLARLLGISQPQIHNVLKGRRKLNAALADRILGKFEMNVLDLFREPELQQKLVSESRPNFGNGGQILGLHITSARVHKNPGHAEQKRSENRTRP